MNSTVYSPVAWQQKWQNKRQQAVREQAKFFERLSILLQEGYVFSDAIKILLPHHVIAVQAVEQKIDDILRNGKGVIEVLASLNVPRKHLVTIAVAEQNGNMQEAFLRISQQLAQTELLKKQLQQLLVYPVSLLFFLVLMFAAFRTYFFPRVERMVTARATETGLQSLQLSRILLRVPDMLVITFIFVLCLFLLTIFYIRKQSTEKQIYMQNKLPLWRYFFKLSMSRHFARHLGNLLQSGFSLQASIRVLHEQNYHRYVQFAAQRLYDKVKEGDSLSQAIAVQIYWLDDFASFVRHGEYSGFLGKELILYSDLLDEKRIALIRKSLSIVQPTFFIIIAGCIVAAYLSLLLPIYNMVEIF